MGEGKDGLHYITANFSIFSTYRFFTIILIFRSLTPVRDRCLATSNCVVKLLLLVVKLLSRKLGLGKNEGQVIILAEENDLSLDL